MPEFRRVDLEQDFFKEAIMVTGQTTGFDAGFIEKDYFCSLILSCIYSDEQSTLIFKGGTALNKIHAGFYRLSEDLDFSISMPVDSTRGQRSKAMEPIKRFFSELPKRLPGIKLALPLSGRNNSLQYIGEFQYESSLGAQPGVIQVEVGLREPNLTPIKELRANTLVMNPLKKRSCLTVR